MFLGLLATARTRDIAEAQVNYFPNRFASFDASNLGFKFVGHGLEVFERGTHAALNDSAGAEQVGEDFVVCFHFVAG
jgi:hypothetical protein